MDKEVQVRYIAVQSVCIAVPAEIGLSYNIWM